MKKVFTKAGVALAATAAMGLSMFGCATTPSEAATAPADGSASPTTEASADSSAQDNGGSGRDHGSNGSNGSSSAATSTASAAPAPDKTDLKQKDLTDTWDAAAAQIQLNGSSASSGASGVAVDGSVVTINSAGSYVLTGTLDNGCIVVDAPETEDVQLVLNGANITNNNGAAIHAKSADKTILTVAQGTQNTVADGEAYSDASEDAPNAAIYADCDLSINGTGTLTVTGNNNNGIGTKDDLKIANGNINVTAVNNALKGKDSVSILDGTFTLEAGGDAIQSDKADDAEKGWVVIDGGSFTITAGNDAVQAETGMTINDGTFNVTTNGGSENAVKKTSGGYRGQGGFSADGEPFGGGRFEYSEDGTNFRGGRGKHGRMAADEAAQGDAAANSESQGALSVDAQTGLTPTAVAESADASSAESGNAESSGAAEQSAEGRSRKPQQTEDGTQEDGSQASSDGSQRPSRPSDATTDGTDRPSRPSGSDSTDSTSSDSAKGLKADGPLTINGGTFQLNCSDDAVHSNSSVLLNGGTFTISSGDDGVHADGDLRINTDVNIETSYEGLEGANVYIESGSIQIKSSDDSVNASGGNSGQNVLEISGGTFSAVGGGDGLDSNGDIKISGGDVTMLIRSSADNEAIDVQRSFTVTGGNIIYGGTGTGSGPDTASTQSYVFAQGSFAAGTEVSLRSNGQTLISFTPSIDCSSLSFSIPGVTSGQSYEVYAGDTLVTTATAGQGGTGMMGGMGGGMMGGNRPQRPDMGSQDGTTEGTGPDLGGRPQRPDMSGQDGTTPDGTAPDQNGRPQRPGSSTADGVTSPTPNGPQDDTQA